VPTPVGPLGPDEIDPFDPDLWDWEASESPRAATSRWIRATAWVVVIAFGLLAIASLFR
jgi:hypothetical protein